MQYNTIQIQYIIEYNTRGPAVAVIADRPAYDVHNFIRYSYIPLSGIAVVTMNTYLFRVSN